MDDAPTERRAMQMFDQLLDIVEVERDAWIENHTIGRPELRARVLAMREADREVSLRTGGVADVLEPETAPTRIGAYRIIERIGRGGMGAVYRGERETGDFKHQVAVKVIKAGLLSESLVERFRVERQTLATLVHPNIARLYDGGETAEGAPYIVMELVDGLPLLQWADEKELSRDRRLLTFSAICEAVGFAHHSLIVHRDLTPSNVLVTRDGTVKLIDFGIAKPTDLMGEDDSETRASIASLSLTPGYAAPERRISARVSTAADIFSLGRILERLVSPSPSDHELRAIVAMATAERPGDRYLTVEALADDVAALRTGQPISAVRGGGRYLATKFVQRNRTGVIAASVALVLLVAALILALAANQRERAARADAEHRFAETRKIANTLLFDAFDEVSRVPGSTSAREMLARTGLDYLDALAADRSAPLDVKVEAGRGFTRLATVTAGEGSGMLAKVPDGDALFAKAEAILGPLIAKYPDDRAIRTAYAELLLQQSVIDQSGKAKYQRGGDRARQAQSLVRGLATKNEDAAAIYLSAMNQEAQSFGWLNDYTKALPIHRRAEYFTTHLPPALRGSERVAAQHGSHLRAMAETLAYLDRRKEAIAATATSVAIARTLLRRHPGDPTLIRRVATAAWYHAVLLRSNGQNKDAQSFVELGVKNARQLRQRDPDDLGSARLSAVLRSLEAQILADLGRFRESFAVGDESVAITRRMAEIAGKSPGAMRNIVSGLSTYGGNAYNGRDFFRACKAWSEAYGILAALDRKKQLSEFDRAGEFKTLTEFLAKNCNPPRAGMGPKV